MIIGWHCRGCGESGKQKLDLNKIIEQRKKLEDLLTVVERLIDHNCSDRQIGIKTAS